VAGALMGASLAVFRAWVLTAALQMGIPAPTAVRPAWLHGAVAVTPHCTYMPQNCGEVWVDVSALCYGDSDFLRQLAYHEVCHLLAGDHHEVSDTTEKDEEDVAECVGRYAGLSPEVVAGQDGRYKVWLSAKRHAPCYE